MDNNQIEEYNCTPDFYINENPFQGPKGLEKTRDIAYDFPLLNTETFCDIYGYPPTKKIATTEKKGFLNTIFSWLGK